MRESAIKNYTSEYLTKKEDMMKNSLQKRPLGKIMFKKKKQKTYFKSKPKPKVLNRGQLVGRTPAISEEDLK